MSDQPHPVGTVHHLSAEGRPEAAREKLATIAAETAVAREASALVLGRRTVEELAQDILAAAAGVPAGDMRRSMLDSPQIERLRQAVDELKGAELSVQSLDAFTMDEAEAACRRARPRLLLLDAAPEDHDGHDERLRDLARELELAVVVAG